MAGPGTGAAWRQPHRRAAGRPAVLSRLVTSPDEPSSVRPVDYKGEPLDAERGPGLGCFRFQVVLLVVLIILTPLTVAWSWPVGISVAFLFITLVLLLFAGQTVIFLLRLVAADRREGRRRPLGSATPTVGELEDEATAIRRPERVRRPSATPAGGRATSRPSPACENSRAQSAKVPGGQIAPCPCSRPSSPSAAAAIRSSSSS